MDCGGNCFTDSLKFKPKARPVAERCKAGTLKLISAVVAVKCMCGTVCVCVCVFGHNCTIRSICIM